MLEPNTPGDLFKIPCNAAALRLQAARRVQNMDEGARRRALGLSTLLPVYVCFVAHYFAVNCSG